jgi:hypothetical protein
MRSSFGSKRHRPDKPKITIGFGSDSYGDEESAATAILIIDAPIQGRAQVRTRLRLDRNRQLDSCKCLKTIAEISGTLGECAVTVRDSNQVKGSF